jgi:hypothetical protein
MMGERWKTALRFGLPWGITMPILMTALEAWERHTSDVFMTSFFAVKLVFFLILGILVGYYNYKPRQKDEPKP